MLDSKAVNLFANVESKALGVVNSKPSGPPGLRSSATLSKQNQDGLKGLNREEFAKLLDMIGLGTDKNLIDKLFWIFDDDGNGEVDHKELAVGLEMLKENTFADKLDRKIIE